MNPIPNRVVIYTKDVCNITGLRARSARKLLFAIRKSLNKPRTAFITVREFSAYTGIQEETLRDFLV